MALRDFVGWPAAGGRSPRARAFFRRPKRTRGWDPADTGRLFGGWTASIGSADEEVERRQAIERGRSRELERTNPYAVRFYVLYLSNVFGPAGIRLVPRVMDVRDGKQIPDGEANAIIRDAWLRWGKRAECTVEGRHSWPAVQKLLGVSYKRDGEVFLRLHRGAGFGRFGFRVQLFEADYCPIHLQRDLGGGNVIRMGIERNQWNRPVAYWMSSEHPGDAALRYTRSAFEYQRIPAEEILHLYDPKRIGQSRGLPALEAGMAALHMLGGYEEAELVAARVAASKMGFLKSETGEGYVGHGEAGAGDEVKEGEIREELEPGVIDQLPKDWDFVSFDPQHPTSAFEPFVKQQLRRFSAAAGPSYESMSHDLQGVTYSSLREGRLAERDLWRLEQDKIVEAVCDPVYDAWLPQALLSGELGDLPAVKVDRFRAHRWQPRRWEWIDPQKEAQAHEIELDSLTTSVSAIIESQGREVRDVFEEIATEMNLADEFKIKDLLPYVKPRRNTASAPPAAGGDEA